MPTIPDSNVAQWNMIVGFFLSPIIAVILSCHWRPRVKAVVAFAVYVAVGLGTVWAQGKLDTTHWATTLLAVIATAVSGYVGHQAAWGASGISGAIEVATTPGKEQ